MRIDYSRTANAKARTMSRRTMRRAKIAARFFPAVASLYSMEG